MVPMPRDSGHPLLFNCPTCGQKLTFHNSRTESNEKAQSEVVEVYFCIKHGFFHFSESKGVKPGM